MFSNFIICILWEELKWFKTYISQSVSIYIIVICMRFHSSLFTLIHLALITILFHIFGWKDGEMWINFIIYILWEKLILISDVYFEISIHIKQCHFHALSFLAINPFSFLLHMAFMERWGIIVKGRGVFKSPLNAMI